MNRVLVRAWIQSLYGGVVQADQVVLEIPDSKEAEYDGRPLDELCAELGHPIPDFDVLTQDHLIHRTPEALLFEVGIYPDTGKRIS